MSVDKSSKEYWKNLRKEQDGIYKELYAKYNWTQERDMSTEYYKDFEEYGCAGGKYKLKFGQWFLYEIEVNQTFDSGPKHTLHFPKLGIFHRYQVCDQALEVEYLEYIKSWEDRLMFRKDSKYDFLFHRQIEIKSHIDWYDSMWVYGAWDHKPNWKELKKAFLRTQWYHRSKDELRDYRLGQLLR